MTMTPPRPGLAVWTSLALSRSYDPSPPLCRSIHSFHQRYINIHLLNITPIPSPSTPTSPIHITPHLDLHRAMAYTPPPAIKPALRGEHDDAHNHSNHPHIKLADAPPPVLNSATLSPTSPRLPGILSTTHTPRTSISGPPGSSGWSSSTTGFPRTHTGSTSIDGGKYRRKVAFETFDDLPDTLFTFTAQVSSSFEHIGSQKHGAVSSGGG